MRKLTVIILCLACLLPIAAGGAGLLHATEPKTVLPWTTSLAEHPAGSYRYTVNGWEDTSYWRLANEEPQIALIDTIHPLVLTLLVVCLSSWLAILASDDESVAAFWKESERR